MLYSGLLDSPLSYLNSGCSLMLLRPTFIAFYSGHGPSKKISALFQICW